MFSYKKETISCSLDLSVTSNEALQEEARHRRHAASRAARRRRHGARCDAPQETGEPTPLGFRVWGLGFRA